jgi:hypothetical protein
MKNCHFKLGIKIFIGILLVAIPINEYLRHNISNEALSLIYKDSVLEITVRMLCFADIN